MVLDGEKVRLEEMLAEAVPAAALETLRQLLGSDQEPDPQMVVTISRTVHETWSFVKEDGQDEYRLANQRRATVVVDMGKAIPAGAAAAPAPSKNKEEVAEKLLSEMMRDEDDLGPTNGDGHPDTAHLGKGTIANSEARLSPGKAIPTKAAPAKTAPGREAKPVAKPQEKPKQKPAEDDDRPPRVPVKYWITLGTLAFVLLSYWGWSLASGPLGVDALASNALSGGSKENRLLAAQELLRRSPTEALPQMRRVAKESKDPEVQVLVINLLQGLNDVQSLPTYLDAMKDVNKEVREAGLKAALRIYGDDKLPLNVSYAVDAPPDQRELAVGKLLDHLRNPPAMSDTRLKGS